MMKVSPRIDQGLRLLLQASAVSVALIAGAEAQTPAGGQASTKQALTATEQAAVAQLLNQVNALSGPALQSEVRRLTKQYSDQNLNVTAIALAAKTAAGNKLGAVNVALNGACKDAPVGSVESVAVCSAAAVQPESLGPAQKIDVAALPNTAALQTAALGAGGGAGGTLTGGTGTGTGTGNGTGNTGATLTSGSAGTQSYSGMSFSGRGASSSVGSSVSQR